MGNNYGQPPVRGDHHEQLEVFVGTWKSEGWSYGGQDQDPDHPKKSRQRWESDEVTHWHPGQFFLVQTEDARVGDDAKLITHSVLGFDDEKQEYYAHAVENHGFYRRYTVRREGCVWTLTSELERARIEFSDGNTQQVTWEWRPRDNRWLPLCERTNCRVNLDASHSGAEAPSAAESTRRINAV